MPCSVCSAHSIICGGCGNCLKHCGCAAMPGPTKVPSTVIICRGRPRNTRCQFCQRPSTKLCDFPLTGAQAGKTCDAPMCAGCAYHLGKDVDFCPPHYRYRQKQAQDMRAKIEEEGKSL